MGLVYLPYKTVGSFGGFHVYVNISYIECLGMMEGLFCLFYFVLKRSHSSNGFAWNIGCEWFQK